jgi:hypothetical protein
MDMTYVYLAIGAGIAFFLLGWYMKVQGKKELLQEQAEAEALAKAQAQQLKNQPQQAFKTAAQNLNPEMLRLQLQAYERLTIFVERIGLGNLLGRMPVNEISAAQLQGSLVQNIKSEFEYNVSQQLYVSPTAWDAVKNLKEQNIFIVNQVASMLPAEASGMDLSKKIVELLSHDENASLQNIVSALLQKEARQLIQS